MSHFAPTHFISTPPLLIPARPVLASSNLMRYCDRKLGKIAPGVDCHASRETAYRSIFTFNVPTGTSVVFTEIFSQKGKRYSSQPFAPNEIELNLRNGFRIKRERDTVGATETIVVAFKQEFGDGSMKVRAGDQTFLLKRTERSSEPKKSETVKAKESETEEANLPSADRRLQLAAFKDWSLHELQTQFDSLRSEQARLSRALLAATGFRKVELPGLSDAMFCAPPASDKEARAFLFVRPTPRGGLELACWQRKVDQPTPVLSELKWIPLKGDWKSESVGAGVWWCPAKKLEVWLAEAEFGTKQITCLRVLAAPGK